MGREGVAEEMIEEAVYVTAVVATEPAGTTVLVYSEPGVLILASLEPGPAPVLSLLGSALLVSFEAAGTALDVAVGGEVALRDVVTADARPVVRWVVVPRGHGSLGGSAA